MQQIPNSNDNIYMITKISDVIIKLLVARGRMSVATTVVDKAYYRGNDHNALLHPVKHVAWQDYSFVRWLTVIFSVAR